MLSISQYNGLEASALEKELIQTCHDLSYNIREHATLSSDYHVSFLKSYAQSAGGNVSAKRLDAEHAQKETMQEIIERKGAIDALTVQRDLIILLLNGVGRTSA